MHTISHPYSFFILVHLFPTFVVLTEAYREVRTAVTDDDKV